MRKNAVLLAFTLAAALGLGACGPDSKQACSGPGQCPAGQFCAAEGICWADTYPPAIDSVTVACAAPCARDGVITVTAVARDESRLAEVRASLDLDPAKTVVLAKTATGYGGQLQLAQWPFPAFERKVSVTVVAKDEAGNTKAQVATDAATVTRVKWVYEAGANVASVAVADDGAVYLGVLRSPSQLVKVMNGTKAWDATVGTLGVSAVAIGTSAIWTGNQDGKVFAVSADGAVLNGAGCNAGSAVVGVSISGDTALAAGSLGSLTAVDALGACFSSTPLDQSAAAPVISRAGEVYLSSQSVLRRLALGPGLFVEKWFVSPPPPTVGLAVNVPLAMDATDGVWTLSTDGKLNRSTAAGATATIKSTSSGKAGPIILADGSLVFGDASKRVLRIGADGSDLWATPPTLDATALTAMALAGGDAGLVVETLNGTVYGLRQSDGAQVWSGSLGTPSAYFQAPTIHSPPGSATSTGYFPAGTKLYAVVLDGRLDGSAPWPKAFHDARNTGNAATVIP